MKNRSSLSQEKPSSRLRKKPGSTSPPLRLRRRLVPPGACRVGVVEVDGMPRLQPSCTLPAGRDGGQDPFAQSTEDPEEHRGAAPGQPPGRLPLLPPERELRAFSPGVGPGDPGKALFGNQERTSPGPFLAFRGPGPKQGAFSAAAA